MKVAAFDVGGSNTKGIIFEEGKIISKTLIEGNSNFIVSECFKSVLTQSSLSENEIDKIIVTGGFAKKIDKGIFRKKITYADEIESIAAGARFLTKKEKFFVASIGTGTAFIIVDRKKAEHLGGSGVGGGTIKGLSSLILNSSVDEAERLAINGIRKNVDMTVYDIIGGDLYKIPGEATASNLGKVQSKYESKDVASSIMNMIAETVGVMCYFASKSYGMENDIVVCGRVPVNNFIKARIKETVELFGGSAEIPDDAEFCGAIGAALLS